MGAATTFYAPVHRVLARNNNGNTAIPLNAAPNIDYLASGLQDHRFQANARGSSATFPAYLGWYGGAQPVVANYVPSAIATANIAALANVVSGTAMTLRAATGAGITVLSAAAPAFLLPASVTLSAGVVIDALPSLQLFGTAGNVTTGFYSRQTCVGRAVSITGVVSTTGGDFIVYGYDIYGYPMTEKITAAAGVATTNGKKAFKAITSIVPQFTDAHNYSVGTADIFGLGIRAPNFCDTHINWNSTLITASTGFVAADATTATNVTGDVRGTYAVQSASDGTKRLMMAVFPSLSLLATNPTTGLFGVTQA